MLTARGCTFFFNMEVRSYTLCVREKRKREDGGDGEKKEKGGLCVGKNDQSRASKAVKDEGGYRALNYNE